jgi:hypothetical protein
MAEFKFELGEIVKDKVTGFSGVIRIRSQYLTGCNTYGLQSQKLDKDSVPGNWQYFDEFLLEKIKGSKKIVLGDRNGVKRPDTSGPLCANHNPPSL